MELIKHFKKSSHYKISKKECSNEYIASKIAEYSKESQGRWHTIKEYKNHFKIIYFN